MTSQPKEPEGALRDLWTQVEGLRIYSRLSRDPMPGRLPVVLVHGFGMSSSYMVPIGKRLAAERPVYAPDLPGHGRSEASERSLGVPELAGFLLAWMDAVGLDRVAILSNSMGCQIAVDLAVRWPGRVDRLVLVGPTTEPGARTLWQQLLRLLKDAPAERPSILLVIAKDYGRMGIGRLFREMKLLFEDRIEDKLSRVEAPALVLRGEKDTVVPQRWAEEVARRIGADGVQVISGAGHALNYSAADELMRRIRGFLREGDGG